MGRKSVTDKQTNRQTNRQTDISKIYIRIMKYGSYLLPFWKVHNLTWHYISYLFQFEKVEKLDGPGNYLLYLLFETGVVKLCLTLFYSYK